MARYEHLPIYKAALDMTVHMERLVVGASRQLLPSMSSPPIRSRAIAGDEMSMP